MVTKCELEFKFEFTKINYNEQSIICHQRHYNHHHDHHHNYNINLSELVRLSVSSGLITFGFNFFLLLTVNEPNSYTAEFFFGELLYFCGFQMKTKVARQTDGRSFVLFFYNILLMFCLVRFLI